MRKIIEQSIKWRGSITDLATDVAYLLTPEEGEQLCQELQRFLALPHQAHKWQAKGHEEIK